VQAAQLLGRHAAKRPASLPDEGFQLVPVRLVPPDETAHTQRAMSAKIAFETPENIQVAYEPAGLGTRFVAWVVDNIVLFCVMIVIFFVLICSGVITEQVVRDATKPFRNEDGSPRQMTPGETPDFMYFYVGL